MREWMERHEYESVEQLKGCMSRRIARTRRPSSAAVYARRFYRASQGAQTEAPGDATQREQRLYLNVGTVTRRELRERAVELAVIDGELRKTLQTPTGNRPNAK
jgi:hypothetical protein